MKLLSFLGSELSKVSGYFAFELVDVGLEGESRRRSSSVMSTMACARLGVG